MVVGMLLVLPPGPWAQQRGRGADACRETAKAAFRACKCDAADEYFTHLGRCHNEAIRGARSACRREAASTREETREECRAIRGAQRALCRDLGGDPYDPPIDPGEFLSPAEVAANPNPYFPLIPGTVWTYAEGEETVVVTVTNETRTILGVTAMVVRDVVSVGGDTVEDTEDYYAQDRQGAVWYFGELSLNYEAGELADLDGSWKAGQERAKAGILMKASPQVGDTYRQEFALREAEDVAEVVSLSATESVPAAACSGNCLVTAETTPLEPDVLEHKYYAPGVGFILGIDQESGLRTELLEVTGP
jgi:hypothetical protein